MFEPSRMLPFPPLPSPPYIYWRSSRRYLISIPSQIDCSPLWSPLHFPNYRPIGCPATKSNFTRLAGIYEYFTQHLASSLSSQHSPANHLTSHQKYFTFDKRSFGEPILLQQILRINRARSEIWICNQYGICSDENVSISPKTPIYVNFLIYFH